MGKLKKWTYHDPYWTMSQIEKLRKEGVPEKDVATQLGFNSTMEMRRWKSGFFGGSRVVYQRWAKYLEKEGKTKNEIALIIGKEVSSVRLLLGDDKQDETAEEA